MPRKVLTLTFAFSLLATMATGLALFIEPPEHVAAWANWSFLGLSKSQWDNAHLVMGLLCAATGAAAFVLNSAALAAFFKSAAESAASANKALVTAFALTALIFLGTVLGMPPMAQVAGVSGFIKEQQTKTYGEPPFLHAEEVSLDDLARRMEIPKDKALAALAAKNISVASPEQSVREIGEQNGLAPGGVYAAVEFAREMSGAPSQRLPKDPPPGLGKRKLSDICEEYELDIKAMLKKLAESGIAASPAITLKEIADANSLLPINVYDAMRSDKPMPVSPPAPIRPLPAEGEEQPGDKVMIEAQVPATQPNMEAQPNGQDEQADQSGQGDIAAPGQDLPMDMGVISTLVPPPDLEKMMLGDFCKEFSIPTKVAVDRLAAQGITAFVDMTFKELALENNKTPEDIMRIITTQ